jgi:hypothetical protein
MEKLKEAISNAIKLHFKNHSNSIKLQIDRCDVDIEKPEDTTLHSGEGIFISPKIYISGMLESTGFSRHIKKPFFIIHSMKIRFNQKEMSYEVIELGMLPNTVFE